MTISILGCGWFGLPLAQQLVREGFVVKGSTTSDEKISTLIKHNIHAYKIDVNSNESIHANSIFFDCDLLIITIPPKTRSARPELYIEGISSIINAIERHHIPHVIYTSSTSVFRDSNQHVNENTTPEPDTISGETVYRVEQMLNDIRSCQTTILRFAGLVGPGRDPGRFFAGKKSIPNGKAPVNLIHLDDCCDLTMAIIKSRAFGYIIHACSPHHPEKQVFYMNAAKRSQLQIPEFIDELREWKIVNALQAETLLNYRFRVTNWLEWLDDHS